MPDLKKSEKFQKEREELINKLFNLLPLDEEHSFILYKVNNDTDLQKKILELVPDIKKYFGTYGIYGINSNKSKKPWICIIRSILKRKYDIFITECSFKNDNKTIRSRKYTFKIKNTKS